MAASSAKTRNARSDTSQLRLWAPAGGAARGDEDTHIREDADDLANAKEVALADVVGQGHAPAAGDVGAEEPMELDGGSLADAVVHALPPRLRGRECVHARRGSRAVAGHGRGRAGVCGGPARHAGAIG